MLLKFKPWERKNGNGHAESDKRTAESDKRAIAQYLVEIAKYAEKMGDLSRDIKLLHVMFFGVDGQGGFAKEIERLREWREEMETEHQKIEIRLSRIEGRRRD